MSEFFHILKMIAAIFIVWIVGSHIAARRMRRLDRELRAEPFKPAYNFLPPRRRRSDKRRER